MKAEPDPAQLRLMQIVSGVMIATAFVVLGIAYWMHRSNPGSLEIMGYLAIGMAVLAPIEVAIVEKVRKPTGNEFSHHVATYGIFEGAALFCAVALMVAPNDWPLYAVVVPLTAMILRFPRAS